jgi:hypothetical protein
MNREIKGFFDMKGFSLDFKAGHPCILEVLDAVAFWTLIQKLSLSSQTYLKKLEELELQLMGAIWKGKAVSSLPSTRHQFSHLNFQYGLNDQNHRSNLKIVYVHALMMVNTGLHSWTVRKITRAK